MAMSSRVPQVYGYAVCLITVVTFLIGASNLTDALFDRTNPLLAQEHHGRADGSLTSFEAYRASTSRERPKQPPREGEPASPGTAADTLTTAELRARYEALRSDHIARVSFTSARRIVKHGLLVVLSLALFLTHWRWLRRHEAEHRAARAAAPAA